MRRALPPLPRLIACRWPDLPRGHRPLPGDPRGDGCPGSLGHRDRHRHRRRPRERAGAYPPAAPGNLRAGNRLAAGLQPGLPARRSGRRSRRRLGTHHRDPRHRPGRGLLPVRHPRRLPPPAPHRQRGHRADRRRIGPGVRLLLVPHRRHRCARPADSGVPGGGLGLHDPRDLDSRPEAPRPLRGTHVRGLPGRNSPRHARGRPARRRQLGDPPPHPPRRPGLRARHGQARPRALASGPPPARSCSPLRPPTRAGGSSVASRSRQPRSGGTSAARGTRSSRVPSSPTCRGCALSA